MNAINVFASAIDCIMHLCMFYINAFYFYVYDHGARLPSLTAVVCWSHPLHHRDEGWGCDITMVEKLVESSAT